MNHNSRIPTVLRTPLNSGAACIVDHSASLFLVDLSASLAGVITQPLEINASIKELNHLL